MKKSPLLLTLLATTALFVFSPGNTAAQSVQNMNGKVFKQQTVYSEVSGSPYLYTDWNKGIVQLSDGKVVDNLEIKFDQIAEVVLYKNEREEELEVAEPVKQFQIKTKGVFRTFRSGFKPVGNNTESNFYEVLADGNVKFIKKIKKDIMSQREYNATSDTKTITEKLTYYIVKDNQPILVAKNEKAILAAIGDKTDALTAFIKQNKLNLKDDSDIVAVLDHYNSIAKAG
ncbi:MAG: hypothetical protein REI78_03640 [Pedobacter sp.]|nr:hypothetical protein [Pedobacter sp.]MDQ8052088.1 hypothetical protein [Pedobacter sp.]